MKRQLANRVSIVWCAIRDNLRSRRYWATRPDNDFTRNGYAVIPDFLDRAECDRVRELAERHLPGPSHVVAGNCYTWVKKEARHGRNSAVRELLNANEIDEGLARLLESDRIQRMFSERLGERVELLGFGVQLDDIDPSTKRGLHVDVLFPPLMKAFIYLTDVEDMGDGPYGIAPGSHRWWFRKFVNDVLNALTIGSRRDMRRFIPDDQVRAILAPAGTMILSTQDIMHKGWGNQWRKPRFVIIAYGVTAPYFRGQPITEGREFVTPLVPSASATGLG